MNIVSMWLAGCVSGESVLGSDSEKLVGEGIQHLFQLEVWHRAEARHLGG